MFGAPILRQFDADAVPWLSVLFGYAGEQRDPETGYYYLRARFYDPTIGRFTSQDTVCSSVQHPAAFNLYVYGLGNPVLCADPSGHVPRGFEQEQPEVISPPMFRAPVSAQVLKIGISYGNEPGGYFEILIVYQVGDGWGVFTAVGGVGPTHGGSVNVDAGSAYGTENLSDFAGSGNGLNRTYLLVNCGVDVLGTNSKGERMYIVYAGVNFPPTEATLGFTSGTTTRMILVPPGEPVGTPQTRP